MKTTDSPRSAPETLKAFLRFSEEADWTEIRRTVDDGDVLPARFYEVIPEPVADFGVLLRTPILFEALYAHAPTNAKSELRQAKEIADAHLVGIEHHPVIAGRIRERVKEMASDDNTQSDFQPVLTEFTRFGALPMWIDTEDGLAPVAGITLLGNEGKELLRVTIDWDDTAFLAFGLIRIVHNDFKRIHEMSNRAQKVDLQYSEKVVGRITAIKKAVDEILELAAKMDLSKPSGG